jgi:LuxR family maltose regulon positive regulatory protein
MPASDETPPSSDATPALPLVLTKLRAPPPREQTVARGRLLDRLRPRPGTKLTIVAAPAGSGKTTLLGTWRELERPARPIAWLSLDDGDNDPVLLWSYVLAALRSECPALGVSASPEVVGAGRLIDRFLPELVNALIAVGPAALVLDDFHRLTNGLGRESMAWFIDHAPATFQLVLGTRSEPPLPLGAMRAHGELAEIRAADLGFTTDEADVLLNDRLDLGLEPRSIDDLVQRTEGWPAGLYLAALSLQAVEDRRAFVTTFGAESRHVVDFLIGEVLEAHDAATQTLMLRCSILDRLSGALCDAVVEREGSAALLRRLAQSNLFLLPLDDRGTWFRFHHLFAQLLRVELEHREPGLAATLHRRASAWYRAHGSTDAAVEHALRAEAFADARELITSTWFHYTQVARHATVVAWIERFPPAVRERDAGLLLVEAWVLMLSGRHAAATDSIQAVERLRPLEDGPLPDGFSSLEASLAVLQGMITWGDFAASVESARRAAALEGPAAPSRALIGVAGGWCLYFLGEFVEADQWLADAAEPALALQQWRVAVSALVARSLIADALGRMEEQATLATRATALEREHGLDGVDSELPIALGAALEAGGDLGEALATYQRGVDVLRGAGQPASLALALIRQARVLRALHRKVAAEPVIAEARRTVDACRDPGILAAWLEDLERPETRLSRPRNGDATLTDRELAVLRALTGPLSEREIGRELYVSHNTVHSHARSIYRKLGVASRKDAVERARELGVL